MSLSSWKNIKWLNSLSQKSLDGVNCLCLSVRLAACLLTHLQHSTSLSLHASVPHLTPLPNTLNLLLCSKPFTSSHLPHLGLPHLLDKDLATPRPKQEVLLALSFWHVLFVTLIRCAVFFLVMWLSLPVREHSKQQQQWSSCYTIFNITSFLDGILYFCMSVLYFLNTTSS